jgi:hypothetical protein
MHTWLACSRLLLPLSHCLCAAVPLQEGRAGKFLTGDKITHGDIAVFCNLSTLQSGWLDGELFSCCIVFVFNHKLCGLPQQQWTTAQPLYPLLCAHIMGVSLC